MCAPANIHTSIIIPTRNHAPMLKRLVQGLEQTALAFKEPIELLIVDNASDEEEALKYLTQIEQQPAKPFAHITVLRYPDKFNYSSINNFAASHSTALHLCFLNNDIEVIEPNWLEALSQPLNSPDAGCVGAMLYYPDNTIQHAGVYLDVKDIAGHLYKNYPRGSAGDNEFLLNVQNVSAVTAACMLVRRSVFEQVKGFNTSLAVAFNDVDFCLRVRDAGYNNIWTPQAELYHHESKSRGQKHQRSWWQKRKHKREVKLMRKLWRSQLGNEPHAHLSCSS